jgi:hypothetical protein
MRRVLLGLAAVVVCLHLGGAAHAGRGGHRGRHHGHQMSSHRAPVRSARYGVALRGRRHHFTHFARSAKYRCKCYWSPRHGCWYYWSRAAGCYYPMSYADVVTPDEDEEEDEEGVAGEAGVPQK